MQEDPERICRFCLTSCDANFGIVEKLTRSMLKSLLLKPSLDVSDGSIICQLCAESLRKAFDFKSRCFFVQCRINSFVKKSNDKNVDINFVYLNTSEQDGDVILNDHKICRICLQMVPNSSCIPLEREDKRVTLVKMTLENYFPELDISITKDPVICMSCHESFQNYFTFVTNCLNSEEKIRKYCESKGAPCEGSIKLSSVLEFISKTEMERSEVEMNAIKTFCGNKIDIKSEDDSYSGNDIDIETQELYVGKEEIEIKQEECDFHSLPQLKLPEPEEISLLKNALEITPYVCKLCTYKTSCKKNLNRHKRRRHISEGKYHKCTKCTYTTKFRHSILRHMRVHRETMYRCDVCVFEAKYRYLVKKHMLIHRDASEVTMYKCDWCTYETRYKSRIKEHALTHRDAPTLTMYKCELCSYKTKYKTTMKRHMLKHKDVSEVNMFMCEVCAHQSKHKSELKKHMLSHKDKSEITTYKCDKCNYEAKFKNDLKTHGLIHKDASEVRMFKCEKCVYQSKYNRCVKRHMVVHKDASEVTMFKCELCAFETKYKNSLKQHRLCHK